MPKTKKELVNVLDCPHIAGKMSAMSMEELDDLANVLRESLPDNSCRTQIGLLLYNTMKRKLEKYELHTQP